MMAVTIGLAICILVVWILVAAFVACLTPDVFGETHFWMCFILIGFVSVCLYLLITNWNVVIFICGSVAQSGRAVGF